MASHHRWFFGFGSLVNDHTLPAGTHWTPATLHGWRRSWRHAIAVDPPWCALDVLPHAGTAIDGLLIRETATLAPLLAAREQGYTPTPLPLSNVSVELPDGDSAWIWVSQSPATDQQLGCLAQSYVDCVLAGFARHFGEDGVDRFIASTDGWHRPLIADRGSPRYPRAVALDAPERALVDRRVASAQHAAIAAHREVTECE